MTDLSITGEGRLQDAGDDQRARLKRVAAQFEGTFIQLIFKTADDSKMDDEPLIGGEGADEQFKQLHESALGERAAGHLGIADMVFRELSARAGISGAPAAPTLPPPIPPISRGQP
jgi:Rod binding domain-containing protein